MTILTVSRIWAYPGSAQRLGPESQSAPRCSGEDGRGWLALILGLAQLRVSDLSVDLPHLLQPLTADFSATADP